MQRSWLPSPSNHQQSLTLAKILPHPLSILASSCVSAMECLTKSTCSHGSFQGASFCRKSTSCCFLKQLFSLNHQLNKPPNGDSLVYLYTRAEIFVVNNTLLECKCSGNTIKLHKSYKYRLGEDFLWLSGKKSTCQCRRHGFDP